MVDIKLNFSCFFKYYLNRKAVQFIAGAIKVRLLLFPNNFTNFSFNYEITYDK